jgi:streptomycin 6-kinase
MAQSPSTDLFLPAPLLDAVAGFGAEGALWLESLPACVCGLERAWSITVERALDSGGVCSWVAPARLRDGSDAILKIGIPHSEARYEAHALRVWNGRGAVRLLRASEDGFTLLLERCVPGADLWTLSEAEADTMAAGVLERLWDVTAPGAPFDQLADVVEGWCEQLPRTAAANGYEPEMVSHAIEAAHHLVGTQSRTALLHGDFHPGNVLSAERQPWLAIDCKPVVGDPAYDLAQWLGNRYETASQSADPVATLRREIRWFAERLHLDAARIAGWTFVKSLGWEWEPAAARTFRVVFTG